MAAITDLETGRARRMAAEITSQRKQWKRQRAKEEPRKVIGLEMLVTRGAW
jgi:hypothetical protein